MSDFSLIDSNDPRYATLQKGFNLRFPTTGQGANAIYVWGLARQGGGRVILRIADEDRERCEPE